MVEGSKNSKEYTEALAYEKDFPQLAQLFVFIPLVERKADLLPRFRFNCTWIPTLNFAFRVNTDK